MTTTAADPTVIHETMARLTHNARQAAEDYRTMLVRHERERAAAADQLTDALVALAPFRSLRELAEIADRSPTYVQRLLRDRGVRSGGKPGPTRRDTPA